MKYNVNQGFRRKSSCSIDQLRQAEMLALFISKIPPFCTFRGVPPVRDTMQKKATLRKLRQLENGRRRKLALASEKQVIAATAEQVEVEVKVEKKEEKDKDCGAQVVGWELLLEDKARMIEMHAF